MVVAAHSHDAHRDLASLHKLALVAELWLVLGDHDNGLPVSPTVEGHDLVFIFAPVAHHLDRTDHVVAVVGCDGARDRDTAPHSAPRGGGDLRVESARVPCPAVQLAHQQCARQREGSA